MSKQSEIETVLSSKYYHIYVHKKSANETIYAVKNRKGKVIADDVVNYNTYSCDNYIDIVDDDILHVKHKDNTESLFNKGKPLKNAYHAKKLTIFDSCGDITRKFSYHVSEMGAINGFHNVRPWKSRIMFLGAAATLLGTVVTPIAWAAKSLTQFFKEQKQEYTENAALIKVENNTPLFDVNADKKTDYIAQNLTARDKMFLSKNQGQSITIGSWKGCLSHNAYFVKHKHPQNEKQ